MDVSRRRKRLESLRSDADLALEALKSNESVSNIEFSDDVLRFDAVATEKITFTIHLCKEEYPESTAMVRSDQPDQLSATTLCLPALVQKILTEIASWRLDQKPSATLDSQVSYASTTSEYSDWDYDVDDEMLFPVSPALEKDLATARQLFGPNSVHHRSYGSIDDSDVDMYIDIKDILDDYTAKAWKVKREEPVIIRLHMSSSHYLDGEVPRISVFQPSSMDGFGLGSQIRNVLQLFLSKQWPLLSCATVEAARSLQPTLPDKDSRPKSVPSIESGFIVQLMAYVQQRFDTLNEYCVICDDIHMFGGASMLKPSVCGRELCVFAYQQLGVMADAAEEVSTQSEVVDLLIAMVTAAAKSPRKGVVFDPYPLVVDPERPQKLAFTPAKKDYDRVVTALDNLPKMSEVTILGFGKVRERVDAVDTFAFPLLQWIISSNRCHIVKLPNKMRLPSMKTPHQYLLISSPPAKEVAFRAAVKKYRSTFAFHGSSIENWHSIMRIGLINASGTKFQVNGAAYGKGIYLSPHSSVSFGYSNRHSYGRKDTSSQKGGSQRFLESSTLTCIALCEVVDSPELRKNGHIWVMPNSDYVCTRFFFVYEGSCSNLNNDTTMHAFREEIVKALRFTYAAQGREMTEDD